MPTASACSPSRFTPGPDHVDVLEWEIAGPPGPEELACLSDDETARAGALRHERDRARFVRARAGLRGILAACLQVAPRAIQLRCSDRGKPELAHPESALRFNLSHSGDRALVAIAQDREVGVDLEQVREGLDPIALARRFFTERECAAVHAYAGGPLQGFFRCWVAKEAYLKARGDGLQLPLDSFEIDVEAEADCLRSTRVPDLRSWRIERVHLDGRYVGAVACERGAWEVRRWRLDPA